MSGERAGTDVRPETDGAGAVALEGPARRPAVVALDDPAARNPRLTGAKAAALARAATAGLPVLPGFAVTTAAVARIDEAGSVGAVAEELRAAWSDLSGGGERSLVVRSSSTLEDLEGSSMAGRFESVVDVRGWEAFVDAVQTVLDSRGAVAQERPDIDAQHPIAVLVQPLLRPRAGGVLFGVDPVTGREDRLVVAAVAEGPDVLVSGEADGSRYELDVDGRCVDRQDAPDGADLGAEDLRALASLASRCAFRFRGPQDVEWAIDTDGTLWLLQSRPVTTEVAGVPVGPVLGPGPVAESFPAALHPLEEDLWIPPLRAAVGHAFRVTATASDEEVAQSPLVVSIGGRVAVDLELFGQREAPSSFLARLDPRPRFRRLGAAWRVGKLRSALPDLAEHLITRTDDALAAVPPVSTLSDRRLLALLERCGHALVSLHGHEILVGIVVDPDSPRMTGTSVALRVLQQARAAGEEDDEIVARHPVVLALLPPAISTDLALPERADAPPYRPSNGVDDRPAALREALRLRVRWVQELEARAALELGRRLVGRGVLPHAEMVRDLSLEALRATVLGRAVVVDELSVAVPRDEPLPARFRCTDRGRVVAVTGGPADEAEGGTGAAPGQARGPAWHGEGEPPPGAVLVTRNLEPQLAGLLGQVAGIVAETGSVLSHVAILARESGVPTVVGVRGAADRFEEGSAVALDGTSGAVARIEED